MHRITIIVSNTKRADDDETESITLLQFTTMDPIQNIFVKMISIPSPYMNILYQLCILQDSIVTKYIVLSV